MVPKRSFSAKINRYRLEVPIVAALTVNGVKCFDEGFRSRVGRNDDTLFSRFLSAPPSRQVRDDSVEPVLPDCEGGQRSHGIKWLRVPTMRLDRIDLEAEQL